MFANVYSAIIPHVKIHRFLGCLNGDRTRVTKTFQYHEQVLMHNRQQSHIGISFLQSFQIVKKLADTEEKSFTEAFCLFQTLNRLNFRIYLKGGFSLELFRGLKRDLRNQQTKIITETYKRNQNRK